MAALLCRVGPPLLVSMLSPPAISMCDGGFLAQKNDYPPYRRQRVRAAVMGDGAFAANQDSGLLTDDEADDLGMRRPATSVYQLLSDEQIANIHAVADALFNVLDGMATRPSRRRSSRATSLGALHGEQVEALFDLLDVNNDGQCRASSCAAVRYPPQKRARDGSLSKSNSCACTRRRTRLEALDLDGNGSLSLEELRLTSRRARAHSPPSRSRTSSARSMRMATANHSISRRLRAIGRCGSRRQAGALWTGGYKMICGLVA